MPTEKDDTNTAAVSGTVSVRSVVLIALASALSSGVAPTCSSRQDEIVQRLDRLEQKVDSKLDRVADKAHELDTRLSRLEGARGSGSE